MYTAFWRYANEGIPMLKSLVLFDQNDVHTHYRNDEFVVGEKILVCPVTEPNARGRRMYFPYGDWYDFWTHELVEGGQELWVDADLDSMPVFVKAGAIIPKYPIQQYVGEKKIEQLKLDVYFILGKDDSQLYEDSHDGYDYIKGRYSHRIFTLTGKQNSLTIQQIKTGKHFASYETIEIKFIGLPFKIASVELNGEAYDHKSNRTNGTSIVFPTDFSDILITGVPEQKNPS
jgi:alpha-glucosidase